MNHEPMVKWCVLSLALALGACSDDASGPGGGGGAGGAGGSAPLLIDTDKGPVEGVLIDDTRAFLGIPYAAPPEGELRFRPPAPREAWTEVLEAKAKGPICAQAAIIGEGMDPNSQEDCLTLNVWAPRSPGTADRPVMVWIHGGGFVLGSGGDPAYDGKVLSESSGAVVVTLNYRLGAFGFLAHAALAAEDAAHPSTGTYGLEDQRAALEWVKTNIQAFGGDPQKVMLFGESAGGISTCLQLVSPASAGLFQSAAIQSGPCNTALDLETAQAQGESFAAAVGCDAAADVPACLRQAPAEDVAVALESGANFLTGGGASWFPSIDGVVVPSDPMVRLASGDFHDVPVILGSNANEATLFFVLAGDDVDIPDDAAFEAFAESLAPGHGAEIVAQYPSADYGSSRDAAIAAVGDAGFVCTTRRAARAISAQGGRAFLYHFTYPPKNGLLGDLGAFHSAEVRYLFAAPGQLLPQQLSEEELGLAAVMTGYWSRHTDAGDPNGSEAVPWPMYDDADQHLTLDLEPAVGSALKRDLCDFWDDIETVGP